MIDFKDISVLLKQGWILKHYSNLSKNDLINIAKVFGEPSPSRVRGALVDELSPLDKDFANPNSLSAKYGMGAFPFHTDTSYWRTPARFIMLYAQNPGANNRPTLLLDALPIILDEEVYKNAVVKVINGKESFLCNLIEESDSGIKRIRLDQGCMVPATKSSSYTFNHLIKFAENQKPVMISWRKGDLLIIDNWRLLHARCNSVINDNDRMLYRVTIL